MTESDIVLPVLYVFLSVTSCLYWSE